MYTVCTTLAILNSLFFFRLFHFPYAEKPREDAAKAQASTSTSTSTSSSSPSPVSPAPVAAAEGKVSYAPGQTALAANKRNVNAWHWEESDYTPWAKKIITDNLKSISIPVPGGGLITITDVTKLSGDAYVNTRKGKTFSGYEFKITIEWKGELNGFSDKGKCHLPEVSADNNLEFEITNIKLDGPEGAEKEALLKTFRSAGRKAITTALEMFHDSLTQLAKDPSSFKPPTDGEKDATAASGKNDDD